MSNVDLEKNERQSMRWRILHALEIGGPWPVNEGTIQLALEDAHYRISPSQIRKELNYLAAKGLIELRGGDVPVWGALLTGLGMDVVQYAAACPEGISRPPKWY